MRCRYTGHCLAALAGVFWNLSLLMIYVTLDQLKGRIPEPFLTQALDDDGDGVIDADAQVLAQASAAVEAPLSGRYSFPLSEPQPSILGHAALIFAGEICYQRRGIYGDSNPFTKEAEELRASLAAIGSGTQPLSPLTNRTQPSASIISEPSRLGKRGLV